MCTPFAFSRTRRAGSPRWPTSSWTSFSCAWAMCGGIWRGLRSCGPTHGSARPWARSGRNFPAGSKARALVLGGLSACLLGWTARAMAHNAPAEVPVHAPAHMPAHMSTPAPAAMPASTPAPESDLLQRLQALIEAHFAQPWRVADYARALCVSPTHLSRVARASTGVSALRLIEARRMREARRNLAYTHLSIATIADTLGYTDPAYFSRAFTRDAGLSPRSFRAQVSAPGPGQPPGKSAQRAGPGSS